jgi:2-aminoadipate transaminase
MTARDVLKQTEGVSPLSRLAQRAPAFQTSPWEKVDRLVSGGPADTIYFGNGTPSREAIPFARMQEASDRAWAEVMETPGALDYGNAAGLNELRDLIAVRMEQNLGIHAERKNIIISNGSQQAIDYLCRLMLDPGDTIIIEGPTYLGALQIFDTYQVNYIVAPMDDCGLDVDHLRATLASAPVVPKLLYTIPTFQNPSGITMPLERRHALVELMHEYGILILEDDPYGELWIDEPPPPALRALDSGVAYLGTFSKTIAPGIRSGWVVAPDGFAEMLSIEKEIVDIHNERLMMRIVRNTVEGFLDDHLVGARALYRLRRDAMLSGLGRFLPVGTSWSLPGGGFFVWVTLPDGISAVELLPFAAKRGVAFLAGEWFYPGYVSADAISNLRLNFSTLPEEKIEEGLRRLGEAIMAFVEQGDSSS